jgi:hypothetical protein
VNAGQVVLAADIAALARISAPCALFCERTHGNQVCAPSCLVTWSPANLRAGMLDGFVSPIPRGLQAGALVASPRRSIFASPRLISRVGSIGSAEENSRRRIQDTDGQAAHQLMQKLNLVWHTNSKRQLDPLGDNRANGRHLDIDDPIGRDDLPSEAHKPPHFSLLTQTWFRTGRSHFSAKP